MDWGDARQYAASRTYRGMRGHLMTMVEFREASAVLAFFQVSSFWLAAQTDLDAEWILTDGPEEDWYLPRHLYSQNLGWDRKCAMYTAGSQINSSNCDVLRLSVIEYECDLTSSIDGCYGTL